MPITVQRTDDTEHVTQISWGDWTLAGRSGSADAELIVGGYHDGEVATIRLDPGESVTGNLTGSAQVTGYAIFDATGLPGAVSLIGEDEQPLMTWTIPGPA